MSDAPTHDSLSRFAGRVASGYSSERSGLGTQRDKGTSGGFTYATLDINQIEAMYRTSWLARKGVDVPADDMLRQGYGFGLEVEIEERLRDEARRLNLARHVRDALIWSRLYGGAGIFIGTSDKDLSEPLNLASLVRGGVQYVKAIPKQYLIGTEIETDPIHPHFGLPPYYQVSSSSSAGGQKIHHSRIVRFVGNQRPAFQHAVNDAWGDSVLEAVYQTISDFAAGQRGIANIIHEASLDVVAIKGLMEGFAHGGQEFIDALMKRTQIGMDMKSSLNALLIDADDSYEQKTASFASLDAIGAFHLKLVASAFSMPLTKFLGEPPKGMNATGEGDERNYHDTIKAAQENHLRGPLEQLYAAVKAGADIAPDKGHLQFKPLRQMSEKDAAELNERNAKSLEKLARTGVIPDGVLGAMAQGMILEAEQSWPGAREAYRPYTDENGVLMGIDPIEPTLAEMEAIEGGGAL